MNLKNPGLFALSLATLLPCGDPAAQTKIRSQDTPPPEALLPRQVAGWQSSGKDQIFRREDLFDYMDGAGEIYLAYGFETLFVREYVKPAAPPMVAELYQMSSSEEAYGIFTHDTEGEERALGQGAYYGLGLLRFWKDRFFVRLLMERETAETEGVLLALGRSIVEAIPREGAKPRLVEGLPREGLLFSSVRYFHQQVSLNCHYYLADANLLNLSEKTAAVLARYQFKEGKVRLLLVHYPQPSEARVAYEQFGRTYFPNRPVSKSSRWVEKVEGDEWISGQWQGRFVILVFEAREARIGPQLMKNVFRKLQEVFPWEKKEKKLETEKG